MSASTANGDTSKSTNAPNAAQEWHDVTEVLHSITSHMELGEMIHPFDFDLHSAMSALEIGDGVLDAAMKERLLYIEDITNNNDLIHKLMTSPQNDAILIGLFDELIKLLWSFFNGNSDQFSIYACLYLYPQIQNHPQNTSNCNKTLYLFIDSIKLCCGYARELVALSGISEDDDWCKIKGFEFSNFTQLDHVTNELKNKINQLKLSENSDVSTVESVDIDRDNTDEKETKKRNKCEYAQALSYRFEFVAVLLHIMKEMYISAQLISLEHDINEQKQESTESKQSIKPLKQLKTDSITIKQTHKSNKKKAQKKQGQKAQSQRNKKNKGGKQQKKGKNKGKQKKSGQNQKKKSQQHQQNRHKKQSQSQSQAKVTQTPNECGMYIIDSGLRATVSSEILQRHKGNIQSLKQLASTLVRIVNHLIETESYGLDPEQLRFAIDDRIGNNKSVHAPRKQRIPQKLETFQLFKSWCKSLRFLCNVCKLDSFDAFLTFLDAFNNGFGYGNFDTAPNVVLRSFLAIIIEQFQRYHTFLWSGKPLIHFIQKSFNSLCEWSRIFSTTNKQYLGDYYTFFSRVETAVRDIIRQKLLHTTRQMDWTKRIIKNFQILETEAPEIDRLTILSYLAGFDEKYHNKMNDMEEYKCCTAAYSAWIMDKCCDSQINFIFLHLNQSMSLYANYELEYVYFYLENLFRAKKQICQNVAFKRYQKVNLELLDELINPQYAKMKARKLKKKGINVQQQQEKTSKLLGPIEANDRYIYLISEAQRCLCLGIFELIQCFYQINRENGNILCWDGLSDRLDVDEKENVNNTARRLGDESLRFAHRFNIFGNVDEPIPITYRQYRTIIYEYDKNYKSLTAKFQQLEIQFNLSLKYFGLLQNTEKFKMAAYETDFITAARRVVIANRIFASKLHKIVQEKKNEAINIKEGFKKHPFYAEFTIENKK